MDQYLITIRKKAFLTYYSHAERISDIDAGKPPIGPSFVAFTYAGARREAEQWVDRVNKSRSGKDIVTEYAYGG